MSAAATIHSVYKIPDQDKYYVLGTTLPDYNNTSQNEENAAVQMETNSRSRLLNFINPSHGQSDPELLGEFHGLPLGEALYGDSGKKEVNLFYMETAHGFPWIILGTAESEEDFLRELQEDEEALGMKPIGQPKNITAWYITENDIPE